MSELAGRLQAYLRSALDRPALQVTDLRRVFGGFSRHTYLVDVSDGPALVVRMDPPASVLESNRTVEYGMYRAMAGVEGVPVPRAVLDEPDADVLGGPFFVTERVDGESSQEAVLASPHRPAVGAHALAILGRIATSDWRALGLGDLLDECAPEDVWRVQLDRWQGVLDEHELGCMPVPRAVLRWLRRNPPPPPGRVAVVHGDYRTENFLFVEDHVTAVLDWEMAHLGDPLEDLTWWALQNWRYDKERPDDAGAFFPLAETWQRWTQASGTEVDSQAWHWWTLLSHVKALAIWVTGGSQFARGLTGELAMPLIPWALVNQQEGWMLAELAAAGGAPEQALPVPGGQA